MAISIEKAVAAWWVVRGETVLNERARGLLEAAGLIGMFDGEVSPDAAEKFKVACVARYGVDEEVAMIVYVALVTEHNRTNARSRVVPFPGTRTTGTAS